MHLWLHSDSPPNNMLKGLKSLNYWSYPCLFLLFGSISLYVDLKVATVCLTV